MQIDIDRILDISKVHPLRLKACYVFGSRVYGTSKKNSDWDIKLIANGTRSNLEMKHDIYNIHIITPQDFQDQLKQHKPGSVECVLAPDEFKIKTGDFKFDMNIPSLRHSFSHTSSNSWVKAKKKLLQNDYEIGIKSMFHSLRIPIFGIQIAKTGKIHDFSEANWIWKKLRNQYWTWDQLDQEFRPIRNMIMSDFRNETEK